MIGVDMGPTPGLGSKPSPGVNLGAEPGFGGPVGTPWESIIQDGTRDMHGRRPATFGRGQGGPPFGDGMKLQLAQERPWQMLEGGSDLARLCCNVFIVAFIRFRG